jgi:hypothetical protein
MTRTTGDACCCSVAGDSMLTSARVRTF